MRFQDGGVGVQEEPGCARTLDGLVRGAAAASDPRLAVHRVLVALAVNDQPAELGYEGPGTDHASNLAYLSLGAARHENQFDAGSGQGGDRIGRFGGHTID